MFEAWRCVVLKYSSVNRVMDPSRGRGVGQALECTTNLRLKKGREAGLRFFPVGVVGSGGLWGGRLRGALVSALVTSGRQQGIGWGEAPERQLENIILQLGPIKASKIRRQLIVQKLKC